MNSFRSKVNVLSDDFQENVRDMEAVCEELRVNLLKATDEGPERHQKRHLAKGSLLARTRISLMLDEDSPFLELCALAGLDDDQSSVGGSVVAGIGLVSGIETIVSANIPTIKGGTVNKSTMIKSERLRELAEANRLPSISCVQSGGADLRVQADVFHAGGGSFYGAALKSKRAEPTMSVVFGSSTAGGAYGPGMSDYVVMVKDKAAVYLGGPPLVKFATGEDANDEDLGGADMHARISGVCDYLAISEIDGIRQARRVWSTLNWQKRTRIPDAHWGSMHREPLYDPNELLGLVSPNLRKPFDIREIVARIVDVSAFDEFKPLYGSTMFTAWANLEGFPIGIIANASGVIFSEAAAKTTQFISLCNQKNTPILFLHNVTGFMVGTKYEQGGIIKFGSQLINAVSNSQVPHISVIIGSSYGAGNYAMCGRAYKPRFLWSWPNSQCAVMGAEQLSGVLDMVGRRSAARKGKVVDEAQAAMQKAMFAKMVADTASVWYTTSRCIDDGVIHPADTRTILGMCLSVIYNTEVRGEHSVSGIARL